MIDLHRYCGTTEPELDLSEPFRCQGWLFATDRTCIVAVRADALVRDSGDAPSARCAPGGVEQEFLRLLNRRRSFRVPFGELRRWALEIDVDACLVEQTCVCGKTLPGRFLRADRQRFGGVVVDREIVRHCIYEVREQNDAVAEVGLVGITWVTPKRPFSTAAITILVGDVFVAVMPMETDEDVGVDVFDLDKFKSAASLGFDT